MREENVAITKEEAEVIFKTPTSNIIKVSADQEVRILQYMIKHHILHFEKVELHATGRAIGVAVDAAKHLERDGTIVLDKLETDLEGEKKSYRPKVLLIVARTKK